VFGGYCNVWMCVYVGFCTVWTSGASCNNESVCLVGIVMCGCAYMWVFVLYGRVELSVIMRVCVWWVL